MRREMSVDSNWRSRWPNSGRGAQPLPLPPVRRASPSRPAPKCEYRPHPSAHSRSVRRFRHSEPVTSIGPVGVSEDTRTSSRTPAARAAARASSTRPGGIAMTRARVVAVSRRAIVEVSTRASESADAPSRRPRVLITATPYASIGFRGSHETLRTAARAKRDDHGEAAGDCQRPQGSGSLLGRRRECWGYRRRIGECVGCRRKLQAMSRDRPSTTAWRCAGLRESSSASARGPPREEVRTLAPARLGASRCDGARRLGHRARRGPPPLGRRIGCRGGQDLTTGATSGERSPDHRSLSRGERGLPSPRRTAAPVWRARRQPSGRTRQHRRRGRKPIEEVSGVNVHGGLQTLVRKEALEISQIA